MLDMVTVAQLIHPETFVLLTRYIQSKPSSTSTNPITLLFHRYYPICSDQHNLGNL